MRLGRYGIGRITTSLVSNETAALPIARASQPECKQSECSERSQCVAMRGHDTKPSLTLCQEMIGQQIGVSAAMTSSALARSSGPPRPTLRAGSLQLQLRNL